jgi:hypothetical protein
VPKLINDFAGHYSRPDLFSLHMNTSAPAPVVRSHAESESVDAPARESAPVQAEILPFAPSDFAAHRKS